MQLYSRSSVNVLIALAVAAVVGLTVASNAVASPWAQNQTGHLGTAPLCDWSCDAGCPPLYQGSTYTPDHGYVSKSHVCDFDWYCLNNWCEKTEDLDAVVSAVETATVEDAAELIKRTPGASLNIERQSVQIADCGGNGIGVNIPLTAERTALLATSLDRLNASE